MADSRTKNSLRNLVYGVANKTVILLLPFATRTIILYLLGASYLGIGTLFSSVLSFLSLAELGLGSAIVYSMYKPIAENDTDAVCALLKYYKRIYRVIGIIILLLGTLVVPAVPLLIKGDIPSGVNAYILYYIYLLNSVISYFFAGYRQSILSAHQRLDITNKISIVFNLLIQVLQIALLYTTRSMYAYAIAPLCGTLGTNLVNYLVTRKKYPDICCKGEISDDLKNGIKKRISGLFGTKLNSTVVHSADVVVVSAFLGLTATAQYGNYYYIMNAVCGFIMIIYSSVTASIGNKLVTDSIEDNYSLFKKMNFFNAWIVAVGCTCFVCLYEPFMELWVGKDYQLGIGFSILMTVYFFVYDIQRTVLTFKDAAGLWYEDRMRPYVSMVFNVVSNFVLVQIIGIYGVVLSSVIAFLISVPWANKVLFRCLFKKSPAINLLAMCKYAVITVVSCAVSYGICSLCIGGIVGLIVRLATCVVVSNIVFLGVFIKSEELAFLMQLIKKRLNLKK